MNILLVGSGGREHALAWKLADSPLCEQLFCAPGNAGIAEIAKCVDIAADDVAGLVAFARERGIGLVVVGPEAPLVAGLVDALQQAGIPAFGPKAAAARLEGSKGFMKDLCAKYDIPTAKYGCFTSLDAAKTFIRTQNLPIVVKADGLAAGKGVIIATSHEEAITAAQDMLAGGAYGSAGAQVVIEQFLDGEEISYFALSDGRTVLPLTSAQDHKRAFDGDKGPNTGGMGAYSPARPGVMTVHLERKILERIIWPTVDAMRAEGCPFAGVLYAGIMVVNGEPYLLEYNARFGDPECQPIMMRLETDLADLLLTAAQGRLAEFQDKVRWSDEAALCVVMAASGYPGPYAKDTPIGPLDAAQRLDGVRIFHAGTRRGENGGLLSAGGRVLGVTARAPDVAGAQALAYRAVDLINWPQGFCRRDIGWRAALEPTKKTKKSISC